MDNNYEHVFKAEKDFAVYDMALRTIKHILKDENMKRDDAFDEIVLIVEAANRSLTK